MRRQFWSRDKDGGHTIRSAIAKNPHDALKLHGSIYLLFSGKGDQNVFVL